MMVGKEAIVCTVFVSSGPIIPGRALLLTVISQARLSPAQALSLLALFLRHVVSYRRRSASKFPSLGSAFVLFDFFLV